MSSYFTKLSALYAKSTEEEKACAAVLFSDIDLNLGDQRLNNLAALTYNANTCEKIFAMLDKALSPQEHPWKTLYKAILLTHTIILFGSELAIDKAILLCRVINPLQGYNSALVKKGIFSTSGGMDYGAPVRAAAKTVNDILILDANIRRARAEARQGQNSLVPMGEHEKINPSAGVGPLTFGQGLESSVGAGHGLLNVPGMYDGRPERYFDRDDDPRRRRDVGDSQHTRDAQAPSLLDLAFDSSPYSGLPSSNLPEAQYIPGLEKQRELERQLAAQTEQLRKLQELQAQQALLQQQQLQQQQQQQGYQQNAFNQPYGMQNQYGGHMQGGYPPQQQFPGQYPPHQQHPQAGGSSLLDLDGPMAPSPSFASGSSTPHTLGSGISTMTGPGSMGGGSYGQQSSWGGAPVSGYPAPHHQQQQSAGSGINMMMGQGSGAPSPMMGAGQQGSMPGMGYQPQPSPQPFGQQSPYMGQQPHMQNQQYQPGMQGGYGAPASSDPFSSLGGLSQPPPAQPPLQQQFGYGGGMSGMGVLSPGSPAAPQMGAAPPPIPAGMPPPVPSFAPPPVPTSRPPY